MAKTQLRAVRDDEPAAPPAPPLSLVEAIAGGDQLQILMAQRRDIARCLPDEKGPAKAALHRQLTLISKEIDALQVQRRRMANEEAEGGKPVADEEWDEEAI